MHPFHNYLVGRLQEHLEKLVVVWYDPRREFVPFIAELRGGSPRPVAPSRSSGSAASTSSSVPIHRVAGFKDELNALVAQLPFGGVLVAVGSDLDLPQVGRKLPWSDLVGLKYLRLLSHEVFEVLGGSAIAAHGAHRRLESQLVVFEELLAKVGDADRVERQQRWCAGGGLTVDLSGALLGVVTVQSKLTTASLSILSVVKPPRAVVQKACDFANPEASRTGALATHRT